MHYTCPIPTLIWRSTSFLDASRSIAACTARAAVFFLSAWLSPLWLFFDARDCLRSRSLHVDGSNFGMSTRYPDLSDVSMMSCLLMISVIGHQSGAS